MRIRERGHFCGSISAARESTGPCCYVWAEIASVCLPAQSSAGPHNVSPGRAAAFDPKFGDINSIIEDLARDFTSGNGRRVDTRLAAPGRLRLVCGWENVHRPEDPAKSDSFAKSRELMDSTKGPKTIKHDWRALCDVMSTVEPGKLVASHEGRFLHRFCIVWPRPVGTCGFNSKLFALDAHVPRRIDKPRWPERMQCSRHIVPLQLHRLSRPVGFPEVL